MIKNAILMLSGAALATVAWWLPGELTPQHTDKQTATVRLKDLPHAGCWFEVYALDGRATTEPLCRD